MSGPKIVAALFGAGLLLTVAWNHAAEAILGPGVREAVDNVETLKASQVSGIPFQPSLEPGGHERLGPGTPTQVPPAPPARRGKPPRAVGGAPSGWYSDESWSQASASSTSRNAGP